MQKRVLISATREYDGKTMITVGLTKALKVKFPNIGFIKPLGMKDVTAGSVKLDQDVVLMEKACAIHANIQDMNPVQVDYLELDEYWRERRNEEVLANIKSSFDNIAEGRDLVVIEGPGHAGSGSAFGVSTAFLAKEFGAKVVLVASGGLSHPVDEITLNISHFMKYGIEIVGVIINKVKPEHMRYVETLLPDMLKRRNVELLGAVPYEPAIANPTMMHALHALKAKVLHGEQYLNREIGKVFVGASRPWRLLNLFEDNGLLITPGDREDLLLSIMSMRLLGKEGGKVVAGIILTGGVMPHDNVLKLLKRTDIPILSSREFSYDVAKKVTEIVPKISPQDTEKIERITQLVAQHVKIDRILAKL
jgi:BioD-like phosphotransacetylase family protein